MFFGSIPALVTPFSGGRVAEDTFSQFVEWQIAEGSDALVPCGTTGESPTLNRDEHREVIAHAVRISNGRVPVIAGCGSYSTEAATEMVRAAADVGADAVLVVVPYYNKPSQEGIAAHFTAIAEASPLPIVVYNVPSRTVADISVETLGKISAHPRIVAIKDASGNWHGFRLSGSPAARTSASCPATTTWRSVSTRWAALAASRSRPMLRRDFAPNSRRRCASNAGTTRSSSRTGSTRFMPRFSAMRRRRRRNMRFRGFDPASRATFACLSWKPPTPRSARSMQRSNMRG